MEASLLKSAVSASMWAVSRAVQYQQCQEKGGKRQERRGEWSVILQLWHFRLFQLIPKLNNKHNKIRKSKPELFLAHDEFVTVEKDAGDVTEDEHDHNTDEDECKIHFSSH